MATEIWRDFDPNLDIPLGLKNARQMSLPEGLDVPEPDVEYDYQEDTLSDDDSQLNEDEVSDELDVPGWFTIVEQVIRTAPDGTKVVDIIADTEDVQGATKYEVRVTKA